jgi:class 3 adenylate cyclase
MISGVDFDQAALQAIGMGAEDFLQRPIDPRLLRARMGACLERKQLTDRGKSLLSKVRHQAREFDGLLRSILPDQVLLEMRNGRYPPRRIDNVAVLFADLVGFTKFCRDADPELVIQPLQNLIERWEDIAQFFSIQKIKTIGDALMCASGLLKAEPNPVEICVRYGLELIRITREINPEWDLRVGINVGPVVAGIVGRRQFLFDLWGDTVNTASRMESGGEKGRICLSEQAFKTISGIARASLRGGHEVKSLGKVNQYLFEGFHAELPSE